MWFDLVIWEHMLISNVWLHFRCNILLRLVTRLHVIVLNIRRGLTLKL